MNERDKPVDPRQVPPLSYLLGYGPAALILAAGAATIAAPAGVAMAARLLGLVWAAAILIFMAGVRRGYGFARRPAPSPVGLAGIIGQFGIALAALIAAAVAPPLAAVLLFTAYAAALALDLIGESHAEAPHHFIRLRPPQLAIAMIGLALMIAPR